MYTCALQINFVFMCFIFVICVVLIFFKDPIVVTFSCFLDFLMDFFYETIDYI